MALRVLNLQQLAELDREVIARCALLDTRFRAGMPGSTRVTLRPLGDVPADLLRAISRAWALLGRAEEELEARRIGATCR